MEDRHQRTYESGDKVAGKVILNNGEQEQIRGLKIKFEAFCRTRTTRPYYANPDNENIAGSRRLFEENAQLFLQEQMLLSGTFTLAPNKHEYPFEFTFPSKSTERYRKSTRKHFSNDPHNLPPSFKVVMGSQSCTGEVLYQLEAKLSRSSFKSDLRTARSLPFCRKGIVPRPCRTRPHLLNIQTWDLTTVPDTSRNLPKRLVRAVVPDTDWKKTPCIRFIPVVHAPKAVAPGQRIPLCLSLKAIQRRPIDPKIDGLILDSLQIDLTTNTRLMCSGLISQPEDTVSETKRCIDRSDCALYIPADQSVVPIVTDFRLVDSVEAVPTFKSYTISRYYTLTLRIGLRWEKKTFELETRTELEILPRFLDLHRRTSIQIEDEIDPLPLYTPREEDSPEYEEQDSSAPTTPRTEEERQAMEWLRSDSQLRLSRNLSSFSTGSDYFGALTLQDTGTASSNDLLRSRALRRRSSDSTLGLYDANETVETANAVEETPQALVASTLNRSGDALEHFSYPMEDFRDSRIVEAVQ
jgi:hypothetical protein